MQLGVNHMGHFLLTNLLLDMLKASMPVCVCVCVSAHIDIGVFLYRKTWADSWFS